MFRGGYIMFISFSNVLKKMSGFRIGFGLRVNKRNCWYILFAILLVIMFNLMWYMIVGAGWALYGMMWCIYKIYYFIFKYIAIGCKKLYSLIKSKIESKPKDNKIVK